MKWLVRDCRDFETVGIQGDETDEAGQESLIWWICARLRSAKIFVIMWSEGVKVLEILEHVFARHKELDGAWGMFRRPGERTERLLEAPVLG